MMNKQLGVAVRRQGKTRDAFGFALIFGLHLLHQGKRWKTQNKRADAKRRTFLQQCFARLSMTRCKSIIDSKQADSWRAIWAFEKVFTMNRIQRLD
jgi:hypothetical protein